MLTIGQYQMLVADACSGLHSMYSLSALGTLFMYIMARTSRLHNAIMVASILPIAFVANIVRVMILVLITYHFGDEAGQGFLHGTAGMVLMLVALACFFALDALLARILLRRDAAKPGTTARGVGALEVCRQPAVPAAREAAELAPRFRRHGGQQVGGELLLERERPRRVAVDGRDAKQQAVRNLPGQPEADLGDSLVERVLDHLVADGQPIGHRLVARTQSRRQAAHLDRPEVGRQRSRPRSVPA